MDTKHPTLDPNADPRRLARALYWKGWRVSRIAEHLHEKPATVHSWKRRDKWDDASAPERIDCALETRITQLIHMQQKGNSEYKELDALMRAAERAERMRRYRNGGNESDLNPKVANRNAAPKRQPVKNAISEEQAAQLKAAFLERMFGYQKHWHRAGLAERDRVILKSRQIGATYYFAHEALIDAIDTGRNQIFLSASKSQALIFRNYIVKFAAQVADVELKGETIILPNGAELAFLGTNSRTAQGYHGNLYLDEFFWIPRYRQLRDLAGAIASQERYRSTYFSTPSTMTHEAYKWWTGDEFNQGRPAVEQVQIDVSHGALRGGSRGGDGLWRQIVTIEDAQASGCNLFNIEYLRRKNTPDVFAQLYLCQFIDDGASVFSFNLMQRAMVDSLEEWGGDWKPFTLRPFGHRPVWLGYDPAKSGDKSALVVLAPPAVSGGKFRILERHQFQGADYEAQAKFIKDTCDRFHVAYIGIDSTGLGSAVYQLVKNFRPDAVAFDYNVELKTKMVLKAMNVLGNGRLEYDAGHTDIAASFMSIKKVLTPSGRQATYQAGRSEETSHADLAWATMHALFNEPLEGASTTNSSVMEIF
ncbi:terminase family protein [Chromobacterium vaccinii]|nr:terminase family protein [Chromobacterium vaccinii]MBX9357030.1 terminase family protein [Chromobacterium vaccinii]